MKDHGLLEAALRSKFPNVYRSGDRFVFSTPLGQVVLEAGRARSRMTEVQLQAVVGLVKCAYSREAIRFAAKRFGWAIEEGRDLYNFSLRKG